MSRGWLLFGFCYIETLAIRKYGVKGGHDRGSRGGSERASEVKQVFLDRKLLVLLSLVTGPKHGYGLMKDIESSFGIRLGPGTLYACIASLEREGLIEALPSVDRRNPYQVTAAGETEVRRAVDEVARVTSVALARVSAI